MPFPPRLLTHAGESLPLHTWCERLGIAPRTLRCRLDLLGWSVADALTTPVDRRHKASGRHSRDMPRPCPPVKASGDGRAYVRWSHRRQTFTRSFGKWGSAEAQAGYRRFQIEWAERTAELAAVGVMTVAELALAFCEWAGAHYRKAGRPTTEAAHIRSAVGVLLEVCPPKLVRDFTGDDFRACQAAMVARGWTRGTVNAHGWRIKRMFRWGASRTGPDGKPLVPHDTAFAVRAVEQLLLGRTDAPEGVPVRSVAWADVEATFPHLARTEAKRTVLEAAIRFQWLTGMRSSELLGMTLADIDRDREEWQYRVPARLDKTAHRGKGRLSYWLGPQAVAIISPRIEEGWPPDRPLFAIPWRGEWRKVHATAYCRAVSVGCEAAGVTHWFPHQLRHSRATEVARIYESVDAAAAAIGDSPEVARTVYVDPMEVIKRRIAKETG